MSKCRIAIYDCYISCDEEVGKAHFNKISEMEKELLENPENEIVGKFFDECSSTSRLEERPEFQKVILQAYANQIDMVVCLNLKNFSRDIHDALSVIVDLDNKGVVLKSHNEGFDSSQMIQIENLRNSRIIDISEFDEEEQVQDEGMTMQ